MNAAIDLGTLEHLANERAALAAQRAELTARIEHAVREAHAAGMSELEIGRRMGVARMTVRKWLGK